MLGGTKLPKQFLEFWISPSDQCHLSCLCVCTTFSTIKYARPVKSVLIDLGIKIMCVQVFFFLFFLVCVHAYANIFH